ncbi:hypothetical protein HYPSUDRAFT_1013919, partial [Hypholoma sublateritium FD-334 SS-4]
NEPPPSSKESLNCCYTKRSCNYNDLTSKSLQSLSIHLNSFCKPDQKPPWRLLKFSQCTVLYLRWYSKQSDTASTATTCVAWPKQSEAWTETILATRTRRSGSCLTTSRTIAGGLFPLRATTHWTIQSTSCLLFSPRISPSRSH